MGIGLVVILAVILLAGAITISIVYNQRQWARRNAKYGPVAGYN